MRLSPADIINHHLHRSNLKQDFIATSSLQFFYIKPKIKCYILISQDLQLLNISHLIEILTNSQQDFKNNSALATVLRVRRVKYVPSHTEMK